jgi:hypothetical protein
VSLFIENSASDPRIIRDIQNRLISPWISKTLLGNMQSTTQIKNIIIMKENKLKVIILKGKVIILRMGLTIYIRRPMTIPTIITVLICPSEVIPLIKYKDKAVPITPEMILDRKPFIKQMITEN